MLSDKSRLTVIVSNEHEATLQTNIPVISVEINPTLINRNNKLYHINGEILYCLCVVYLMTLSVSQITQRNDW